MADTVAEALRKAATILADSSETPRLDAELLMAHALGVSRSDMLLHYQTRDAAAGFDTLVSRRLAHEPVAYILGEQEFYGLSFKVGPGALIPRADSETLVALAIEGKPDARCVLDCGTGSGALLLAVLAYLPQAYGTGVDCSAKALAFARENATRLNLVERVRLIQEDWTRPGWVTKIGGPFDLILANPPYIEAKANLMPDVRDYEPDGALYSGDDGLDSYRTLLPQLSSLMAPDGLALVEIGFNQAKEVQAIGKAAGLCARVYQDIAGRDRVVALTRATAR